MLLLEQLAEERINAAMQRGELSGLPGAGQPLPEEDLSLVPEELRITYKILRNSGFLPPEISLYHEINALQETGEIQDDAETREVRRRKLISLLLRLSDHRDRFMNLAIQEQYYCKVLKQLAGT